ncbi:MAG: OmpA family protein [Magnetococcales bacterium]|nr:OmpA family protein [Magnetococcales bacterium]
MSTIIPTIRKRQESTESPFWISFADLMTALVMLFLVVMSISMVAIASKSVVEKREQAQDIDQIFDDLSDRAVSGGVEIAINRANHTISFGEKVRFAHNSFQLSPEAVEKLQSFVPLLLHVRNTKKGVRWLKRIHIEGYTDQTGTYLYNVNLSLNRAQAVVCALFAGDLLPEERRLLRQLLIIDGAAATAVKESPKESRRVEVRLEFRQLEEHEVVPEVNEMPIGRCALRMDWDKEPDQTVKKQKSPSSDE